MNASGGFRLPHGSERVFFMSFLPQFDAQPPKDIRNVVKNV